MNTEKLNIILDLYKEDKITKEQANTLLQDDNNIVINAPVTYPQPNPILQPYITYCHQVEPFNTTITSTEADIQSNGPKA